VRDRPARSATARPAAVEAGEGHVVGGVDECLRGLLAARRDLHDLRLEAGVRQELDHEQGRQRRERGRLEHDGVAGHQGRERLAEGPDQGEVRRPDDADDAARTVSEDQLTPARPAPGEPLVGQEARARAPPVAAGSDYVGDLGEQRVLVGLAGLGHDACDHAVGVLEQDPPHVPEPGAAAPRPDGGPGGLDGSSTRDQLLDVGGRISTVLTIGDVRSPSSR